MDLAEVRKLTTYEEASGYLKADFKKEVMYVNSLFAKAQKGHSSTIAVNRFGRIYYETSYYDDSNNLLFKKSTRENGDTSYYMDSSDGNTLRLWDINGDGNFDNITKSDGQGGNFWTIKDKNSDGSFDLGYVADGRRFWLYGLDNGLQKL